MSRCDHCKIILLASIATFIIYLSLSQAERDAKAAVQKAYPTINIWDSASHWYSLNMDSSRHAFRKLDMENTYKYLGRADAYIQILDLYIKKDSLQNLKSE